MLKLLTSRKPRRALSARLHTCAYQRSREACVPWLIAKELRAVSLPCKDVTCMTPQQRNRSLNAGHSLAGQSKQHKVSPCAHLYLIAVRDTAGGPTLASVSRGKPERSKNLTASPPVSLPSASGVRAAPHVKLLPSQPLLAHLANN